MTNTVGMACCSSQLVRVPVQSNVQRLSQLQMSGKIQKRLGESDQQVNDTFHNDTFTAEERPRPP